MIALGYLKQVIYILFQLLFLLKKFLMHCILIMLSPSPNSQILPTSPPTKKRQNPGNTHTTAPQKTQAKVDKQKTNKTIMLQQSIMRQKSTKIPLSSFCGGHLLVGVGPCPEVWLIHPGRHLWRKLVFPLPEANNCRWLLG